MTDKEVAGGGDFGGFEKGEPGAAFPNQPGNISVNACMRIRGDEHAGSDGKFPVCLPSTKFKNFKGALSLSALEEERPDALY